MHGGPRNRDRPRSLSARRPPVAGSSAPNSSLPARLRLSWPTRSLRGRRPHSQGAASSASGSRFPGSSARGTAWCAPPPHLEWHDAPIRELVADATGLPTAVDNDATLGAVAEHLYGAARGLDHVVYLNGGASGIGGGLIVHGMPVRGVSGYAGEFGQNRPGIASTADQQAPEGVLEDEVSRSRLLRAVGLTSADDPTLAAALSTSDDPSVAAETDRQRRILATALANAVNVLNPRAIVLGGFLAMLTEGATDQLTDLVRAQSMPANAEDVDIRAAVLADDRLLIGAAEAAFAGLLADPLSRLPERPGPLEEAR